jgi:hypothetical protein
MSRLPTSYRDIKGLVTLDDIDLNVIESKASVLSLAECYHYLTVDENDLSEQDKEAAFKVHRKGRLEAVHKAANSLFSQMNSRNGTEAALSYLKQMSDTFKEEGAVSGTSNGFSFNIHMDEK